MGRYDTLDQESIEALVAAFYARARRDPELGAVFEPAVADWDAHIGTVASFWASVMLGGRRYGGDPLGAHRPHPIRREHFARWLALWGETADALFDAEIAGALKLRAARIAESLQLGLFPAVPP
jgi:hemoglobin